VTDDQLRPDRSPVGSHSRTVNPNGSGPDRSHLNGFDPGAGPSSGQGSAARAALHRLAEGGDEDAALGELAMADVLLPDLTDDNADLSEQDDGVLQLPVAERQDGTQFVPTFTSEQRMAAALPEVARYRTVQLATLGRIWPSDDLVLAVDPGSEGGIALPADGLRALAAMSG